MLVTLPPEEVLELAQVAAAIECSKRRFGNTNWGVSSLASRLYSLCAERCVASLLGCKHEVTVLPGGDGGIDLVLPRETAYGRTIDVKFRRVRNTDLATRGLRFWEELVADLYVLVWPAGEEGWTPLDGFDVVGWATREDFLKRIVSRPPVRMRGEKWEIRYSELRDWGQLVSLLQERAEQASQH